MRRLTLAFLAAAALAGSAHAQSIDVPKGVYVNDPTHSNLLWSVNHFGLSTYYARFDSIAATLDLDPADVTKSKLSVTIDPKSVDTNYPSEAVDFDAEIASEKFLDAAKYPEITFTSTTIEATGKDTGKITGDLTLHGVTKPVTLDVKLNGALNPHPMSKKPALGFGGTAVIKRSDFGIKTLVGPVSDEVQLIIQAEFTPKG